MHTARQPHGQESLFAPGRTAPHDLPILPLPGPGVTVHKMALMSTRESLLGNILILTNFKCSVSLSTYSMEAQWML